MRKIFKHTLTAVLSAAMVLSFGGIGAVNTKVASADENNAETPNSAKAYISMSSGDWNAQYWNDGNDYGCTVVSPEVTGPGTYTTSLDFTNSDNLGKGFAFIDVEVGNGEILFPNYIMNVTSVKVNGEEATLGKGYTASDNQIDTRVNLFNEWVPVDEIPEDARVWDGDKTDITPVPLDVSAYADTEIKTVEVTFDYSPTASYHAYLGFQLNTTWVFRNVCDDATYGLNATAFGDLPYNYLTQYASSSNNQVYDGDFVNVEIARDGTYTVAMNKAALRDLTNKDGVTSDQFNMLFASTDIPLTNTDVKFTDVKVSMDNDEKTAEFANGVLKSDSKTYYQLMVINTYGSESKGDLAPDLGYIPTENITITFTVEGIPSLPSVAYVEANAPVDEGNDNVNDGNGDSVGVAKGKTFKANGITYKVTKAATADSNGTVTVTKADASLKKATVPATVKKNSATYKVASLSAGAFSGCKKLTTVTLGKNIKSIPANAFKNCAKLSSLKLSAKLSSVKKGAFSGCKQTITVSGTSAKANVKTLKKSGYNNFK